MARDFRVDRSTMRYGRCRNPCKVIWFWPKAGSLPQSDFAEGPRCPRCNGELERIAGKPRGTQLVATRKDVGLK